MTQLIERTEIPSTVHTLANKLNACGLMSGQTVLVHMSMSKLGWIAGGAEAVILAFLEVLGPTGTLMMPTHTLDNIDPSEWQSPPVPEPWWQIIRDNTPAYNPKTTPAYSMGKVPELFRSWPGALRSDHPVTSFTALGPNADFLTAGHLLTDETGDQSPLGRLYDLDGHVLLLGVSHWENTSLHLSEARANFPGKSNLCTGSAMLVDNKRQWVVYETLDTSGDGFADLGQAFDDVYPVVENQIAQAKIRFFKQRALVDFGTAWIEKHRKSNE